MASKQRGVHVSLRNVTPTIPGNEFECNMLKKDLKDLGCAGLLERPWNLKNEDFIQQFVLIREGKLERNNMLTRPSGINRKSGPPASGRKSTTSDWEGAAWQTGPTST